MTMTAKLGRVVTFNELPSTKSPGSRALARSRDKLNTSYYYCHKV